MDLIKFIQFSNYQTVQNFYKAFIEYKYCYKPT